MGLRNQPLQIITEASVSLISKLTMLTGALEARTISEAEFWEGYGEALESFIPDGASGDTGTHGEAPQAAPQASEVTP